MASRPTDSSARRGGPAGLQGAPIGARRGGAAPARRARPSARDREIILARAHGETLREIGLRFGLSRQRISRILIESGAAPANRDVRQARTARRLASAGVSAGEVLSVWRSGIGPATVARRLGIPATTVSAIVDEHASTADRAARRRAQSERAARGRRRFSDEQLIDAVRASAEWAGRVPSIADYLEFTRSSMGLPGLDTIGLRFGGWNAALRAAGMTPRNAGRELTRRRWSEAACLEVLRQLTDELGALPSITRYGELAKERADLPSPGTVRNRLGRWKLLALRLETDS